MREEDAIYLRQRAETEAKLADQAKQPEIVAAHRGLADLYRERLEIAGESSIGRG